MPDTSAGRIVHMYTPLLIIQLPGGLQDLTDRGGYLCAPRQRPRGRGAVRCSEASVLGRRATLRRDAGELPRARLFTQIDLGCYLL